MTGVTAAEQVVARPPKPPRVLRWLVLMLVTWLVTGVYAVIALEWAIWSGALGLGTVAVERTARVELETGDRFGLTTAHEDGFVTCEVIPDSGQARSLFTYAPHTTSLRSARLPDPERAWFSGGAEVRCTHPAVVLLPERYSETGIHAMGWLFGASGVLFLVVVVQLSRRVTYSNRRTAQLHGRS
ncbi:hypothetical protein GCM10023222_24720 [Saccharopolyspora cebuensis]